MVGFSRSNSHERASTGSIASKGRAGWLALPLSILVAAACSTDDGGATQQVYNPANGTAAGTTAGTAAGTTAGTVGGTTAGTVANTAGTTAGTSPGSAAGTVGGSTAGTSTGTTAGAGGSTGGSTGGTTGGTTSGTAMTGGTGGTGGIGGPPLKTKCEGGELMGCSSFMSPSGKEVPLGPYGAAVEVNVGKGFENMVDPSDNNSDCAGFAGIFGQSMEETDKLLELKGLDLKLYTVFHPANWKAGEKYPLITWGNGTCAQPEGYGTLLRFIASHGFVVVAANSRYVGTDNAMKHALDFMFKANDDMTSPYYQKLDLVNVGAMGHSQGGMATIAIASDARVKSVIIYNGGASASKPFLAITGDDDLPFASLSDLKSAITAATKAAYLFFHMVPQVGLFAGHLTLMQQPERLTDASAAWWKVLLKDDAAAKDYFVGTSCKLCGKASDFEFGQKGI